MKQIEKILFCLSLFLVASSIAHTAFAHSIEVMNEDGVTIYYNWIKSHTELEVTYRDSGYSSEYSGSVVIPASVEYDGKNYNVTSIGGSAFSGCSNLTSLTIPEGVTSIGGSAFSGCSNLTSLTIPEGVTSIGDWAFVCCSGLTSVTIPESVESIGRSAFGDCTGLTSVNIPSSVTSIDDWTFSGCSGLTSITIPSSVMSIGDYAFDSCSGLTSVTIPKSVSSIGYAAFRGCFSLRSVTVASGNTVYDSRDNCNAIIEIATNTLIVGCKRTTIPLSVTSIGPYAFYKCTGLTGMTIPEGVTSIGEYALGYCSSLTSITIPSSVTSIGSWAFFGCYGLMKVVVPDIAAWCGIIFNTPQFSVYYNLYCDENTEITDLVIPEGVESIGNFAFELCSSLTSVNIPSSVTSIGEYAFDYCSGLKNVVIGNGVTSIGSYAFCGCTSLDYFSFGSNVKTIGHNAFSHCTAMTRLISQASVPPTCDSQALDDIDKWNCTLFVPQGSLSAYQQANQWKEFSFISDELITGIRDATDTVPITETIYDVDGHQLDGMKPGINIIRMSDGTTRKVLKR